MSRLMTGILLVALLGLTASVAMAQSTRANTGTAGAAKSQYDAGDPPTYDLANPNGFPVEATATFKATVLNYAQVSITPPADLTVPGDDEAGNPGSDEIAWDDAEDAGLIKVQANTTCEMAVEVTEFRGDEDPDYGTTEDIWTEIQLGVLKGKFWSQELLVDLKDYSLVGEAPGNPGWFRISSADDDDWYSFGQSNVSEGTRGAGAGTVILSRTMNPVDDFARYWELPFGVLAKNRTFMPKLPEEGGGGRATGYTTLALAQNYTATMYVTLTKP